MHTLFLRFLKEMQNKGSLNYETSYPLHTVSTFGIGGKAKYYVLPKTEEALIETVRSAKKAEINQEKIREILKKAFDIICVKMQKEAIAC